MKNLRGGWTLIRIAGGIAVASMFVTGCGQVETAMAAPPQESPPQPASSLDQVVRAAGNMAREESGKPQAAVRVVDAREVMWSSSALGCPAPGAAYLDVLTPGYLVVMKIEGRRYRYHAGRAGRPFLCPEGRGEAPVGRPGEVAY